ncbi:MAG: SDR family oxidoreductase [Chlorobiaceae bacterium]|jgi:NAD(P)-dependent dehydrogenase (short-subunit alcohol dehydrogenase family)|nr:SDR family oxidoreductase [Chlorobiaceae bacterium]
MEKTVVITGSSRGIGFGLAKRFIERQCNVVLNGSTSESTRKAIDQIAGIRGRFAGVSADISTREGITFLYEEAYRLFGRVDIWVNNAGISHDKRNAWELDPGEIDRVIDTNIRGAIYGTIIPFREMQKQGSGRIFNMEGLGSDGFMLDGLTVYGTSKSALTYFTRSFAHEIRNSRVQMGTISPGMVVTDMLLKTVNDGTPDSIKNRKFFNIVADDVETVSAFLCEKMLSSAEQSPRIRWLTKSKMISRFLLSPFRKRDFFS